MIDKLKEWIKDRLFYLRMWIGRIERCCNCGRRIWIRKEDLSFAQYLEIDNSYGGSYCRECSGRDKTNPIPICLFCGQELSLKAINENPLDEKSYFCNKCKKRDSELKTIFNEIHKEAEEHK